MARHRLRASALGALALIASTLAVSDPPGTAIGAATTAPACARVPSDVNGDGFADVAVGVPGYNRGAVEVILGGARPDWNSLEGLSPDRSGTPAGPDAGFGTSIVPAYFDGDCFADTAIGWGDKVLITWGDPDGLNAAGSQIFTATSAGPTVAPPVLATGDFNGDGHPDLAIGDVNYGNGAGRVRVLFGTTDGLSTAGQQYFTQDTAGVPGSGEAGDHFGAALTTGDFDRDGRSDLAIGVPGEDIGAATDTGDVTVLRGSATGLTAIGATSWQEGTPGIPGAGHSHDAFGASLAVGTPAFDGVTALAIGAPGAVVGGHSGAGTATVLRGSPAGLTSAGAQLWSQDSAGIPGTAETGDAFGTYLTFGNFNGDTASDLVASAPKEDIGAATDAGSVTVIYGALSGLASAGAQTWSQDSAGVAGVAEAGDHFGIPFAVALHGGSYDDLMIGVPDEDQAISGGSPQDVDAGAMDELVGGVHGLQAGTPLWTGVLADTFRAHAHFAAALA